MKKGFLLIISVFCFIISVNAQICNNLFDSACQCKDSVPPAVYLRNGSFEEHTPDCFTNTSEVNNFQYPIYWTYGDPFETVDYFYLGCPQNVYEHCPPALPLPDGNAFIQIFEGGDNQYGEKGYIATCLANPLQANTKYSFEFYIGFCIDYNTPLQSHEFVIYGHPDCDSIPFGLVGDLGCPTNVNAYGGGWVKPGWVELGSAIVSGNGNWVKARIDFTAPENINGFIFGPNCTNIGNLYNRLYFYADNFSLTETSQLKFRTITADSGNCSNGIVLHAPPNINVKAYQWYKDSMAIVGATDSDYIVPANANAGGNYNVRISLSNTCILSDPFYVDLSVFKNFDLGRDTLLCYGDTLTLKPGIENAYYFWQNGSTSDSFLVTEPGTYTVQVTNQFGCSVSKSVYVNFQNCTKCDLYIPSAFTPNGDGRNDVFRVKSLCAQVDEFHLIIYNRWGQPIFESSDISNGWDGALKGQPEQMGTYIYFIRYKKYGETELQQKKGVLTLLR